jgi:hypothetical protein
MQFHSLPVSHVTVSNPRLRLRNRRTIDADKNLGTQTTRIGNVCLP